jgi:hypothetical protein
MRGQSPVNMKIKRHIQWQFNRINNLQLFPPIYIIEMMTFYQGVGVKIEKNTRWNEK